MIHHLPLHESILKSTGVGRFSWLLPQESQLRPAWPVGQPDEGRRLSTLRLLAEAAAAIASIANHVQFEHDRLVSTYRSGLRNISLLRGNPGRLALEQIAQRYLAFIQPLTCIAEFSSLPKTHAEALAQVPRLVRLDCNSTHPIRHLTLLAWIFRGWATFWEEYCRQARDLQPAKQNSFKCWNESQQVRADPRRLTLLTLLSAGDCSLSGAARRIGVDPATAMAWAAQAGIPTPRRAKKIKPESLKRLIEMLASGMDTAPVAKKLEISPVSVIRVLRTEVGLHAAWKQARLVKAKTNARNTWHEVVTANPRLGVKAVRTLEPSVYVWLYRHDRSWLDLQSSRLQKGTQSNHAKTDWDKRDVALAASIQQAVLDIASEQDGSAVTLWKIYQQLPDLKSKLNQLDRLPLSKKALKLGTQKKRQGN